MNPNIPNTNNLQNNLRSFGQNCTINTMGLIQFIGYNPTVITYEFFNAITTFITREEGLCKKTDRMETQQRMAGIDRIIQNSTLMPEVKQQQVIDYIRGIQGRNYWTGNLYKFGGKRKTRKNKRKSHKRKSHKKTNKRRHKK
jgi:hypothetical protein